MLLAGLTTGHKIGLGVVGLAFVTFALTASFVIPRRRPDFPGKNGLSVFIIACIAFFVAMLSAVVVFGRESEAKGAEPKPAHVAAGAIQVQESEFKIVLASKTVPAGKVTFDVKNDGKISHDLAVQGPGLSGTPKTALINAGGTAALTVTLAKGTYTVYCTVAGHRSLGMVATITAG